MKRRQRKDPESIESVKQAHEILKNQPRKGTFLQSESPPSVGSSLRFIQWPNKPVADSRNICQTELTSHTEASSPVLVPSEDKAGDVGLPYVIETTATAGVVDSNSCGIALASYVCDVTVCEQAGVIQRQLEVAVDMCDHTHCGAAVDELLDHGGETAVIVDERMHTGFEILPISSESYSGDTVTSSGSLSLAAATLDYSSMDDTYDQSQASCADTENTYDLFGPRLQSPVRFPPSHDDSIINSRWI